MSFELAADLDLNDFVETMVNEFGKENCTVGKTQLKLGDQTLKGKRINVSVVGQNLKLDILKLESSKSMTRFLALQDALNEDGSPSAESRQALKMINESVSFSLVIH